MSRLLAIGDIHGCYRALTLLAEFVPFRDDDIIVTLGDYVDRGPETKQVLDWLIDRYAAGNLIPLKGNHELMMLDAFRGGQAERQFWRDVGGVEALDSYGKPGMADLADIPTAHWNFLDRVTRRYHETDTHIFVHANLDPDRSMDEQEDNDLFWEPFRFPIPHISGKIVVCGHTQQRNGLPRDAGCTICIDTWAYGEGWLTCLDPVGREYWQANQAGETRHDWLAPSEWS